MLRADLWVAAFVRRHNDIGHICVVAQRGDPIAGQILIEIDHLNGTVSLLMPAPSALRPDGDADRLFSLRLSHQSAETVRTRIAQEQRIDPDLWVIGLEMRGDDAGVRLVG